MAARIEVTVPDLGDHSDIPVIELLVAPGDRVELDDPLLTLESDKASMDIPSPAAGVVAELRVELGDEVSQGDVLLVIDAEAQAGTGGEVAEAREAGGGDAPAPGAEEVPAAAASTGAEPSLAPQTAATAAGPGTVEAELAGESEWPENDPRAPASLRKPPPTTSLPSFPGRRTAAFHATPSVRRLARSLGVNLAEVPGTGRKGRILAEDIERYVKQRLAPSEAVTAAAPAPGRPAAPALAPLPVVDFSKYGATETKPLSRIKRRTAANLSQAWLHIPLVTHFDETDVTDLDAFRRSLRDDPDARGARLTLVPFAMKALVATLRAFPTFNSSLAPDGENLILKHYFNIGIAVDTPEGLVVPVVREVDRKPVIDLALELAEVSERTRARKLRPDDLQGSCMTISSIGGIGGTGFTPLVNPPEVAILGLARMRVAPVWNGSEFEPRTVLPICLSYDHRVIDGAEAARFSRHLCLLLADVRRLLL